MTIKAWHYRVAALVALAPWIAAFFAPFYQRANVCPHWSANADPAGEAGWILASWGWLGPLGGSFAWYANVLLIWLVARLSRGQSPGKRFSLVALALSLTALLPAFIFDFEQDGRFHCQMIYGPAVWLWIATFVMIAIVARAER